MHVFRLTQLHVALATFWLVLLVRPVCVAQDTPELQPGMALWQEALRVRARLGQEEADRNLAFRAAALEAAIGMPERALAVLAEHAGEDSLWEGAGFRLRGEAEYALGQWESAARSFERAFELTSDTSRGVLSVRAGVAYERAGLNEAAAAQYSKAASQLPALSEWLAICEASVSGDTAHAFQLLANGDSRATTLAARARGVAYARAGDTTQALAAYETGGYHVLATELALAFGDTTAARRFAYAAIALDDTAQVRGGVALIDEHFEPLIPDEFLALAAALRRVGTLQNAVQLAAGAVAAS